MKPVHSLLLFSVTLPLLGQCTNSTPANPLPLVCTTAPLPFYYVVGQNQILTASILVPTEGALYSVTTSSSYPLLATLLSTNSGATLSVSTNASGLNAGVYTGQITLAATNSFITFKQIMIPVVLTVNVFAQPNVKAIVNAADATGTLLGAPNTWMTLYGTNLAPPEHARSWQTSDFINNQMPTNLDGVSVSFGGASGYISYISPTQINVLTPPSGTALDEMQLTISLGAYSVTNCGSNPWPAVAVGGGCLSGISFDLESPAFFTFDGQHVAAEHADGSLIGPASLIPGQTAPAKPGEAIVLYGNGFGTTSIPIIPGSVSQSGALPSMPIVEIGGLGAAVQFAGSISPGLYQINVVVPASAIDGDNILSAIYDKMNTQPGVFLSVQH